MVRVQSDWLRGALQSIFIAAGLGEGASKLVAANLEEADRAGLASHGAMLVPMYIERIKNGSVSLEEEPEVIVDSGAVVLLDAKNALGQLSSTRAMKLAQEKAKTFGIGFVSVRNAFHFGRASAYVRDAADAGLIGIAASNTRPMMPAIGGAEPVVGNNPLAVAVPSARGPRVILDMALSEAALGKIRIAAAEGEAIPDNWATDADGLPTEDPDAAIKGMLLPAGGAKGFGLALIIEVLTGVLSGGGWGSSVTGLYADPKVPNNCAHFFAAINPDMLEESGDFGERMSVFSEGITGSRRRADVDRLWLPGERSAEKASRAKIDGIDLADSTLKALHETAESLNVSIPARVA